MSSKIIVSGAEYLALPREPETWIVQPLLPAGGAMLIYGEPKVGKSYLALQLALAIETGEPFLGFPVRSPGRVVYIQLDTPRSLWALRLAELHASGVQTDRFSLVDRETLDSFPYDVLKLPDFLKLRQALSSFQPKVVVIDTIREVHSGDENDSTVMRNVIAALTDLTRPAALVIVSHPKKTDPRFGTDVNRDMRGSTYVVGKMDTNIYLHPRSLTLNGRALEAGSIKLHREDNGFWTPVEDEVDDIISAVQADETVVSQRAKAREVAKRAGISENAARMRLRRLPTRSGSGREPGGSRRDPPSS